MKAYKVYYDTPDRSGSTTLLCESEEKIEEALEAKDDDYQVGNNYCQINHKYEISVSSFPVDQLSLGELMLLIGKKLN